MVCLVSTKGRCKSRIQWYLSNIVQECIPYPYKSILLSLLLLDAKVIKTVQSIFSVDSMPVKQPAHMNLTSQILFISQLEYIGQFVVYFLLQINKLQPSLLQPLLSFVGIYQSLKPNECVHKPSVQSYEAQKQTLEQQKGSSFLVC